MMFSTPTICFEDFCNFCGKISLKQFSHNYCENELSSKGIFPYSFFKSIEEIRNCKSFPTYDQFQNELNAPSDQELEQ